MFLKSQINPNLPPCTKFTNDFPRKCVGFEIINSFFEIDDEKLYGRCKLQESYEKVWSEKKEYADFRERALKWIRDNFKETALEITLKR